MLHLASHHADVLRRSGVVQVRIKCCGVQDRVWRHELRGQNPESMPDLELPEDCNRK